MRRRPDGWSARRAAESLFLLGTEPPARAWFALRPKADRRAYTAFPRRRSNTTARGSVPNPAPRGRSLAEFRGQDGLFRGRERGNIQSSPLRKSCRGIRNFLPEVLKTWFFLCRFVPLTLASNRYRGEGTRFRIRSPRFRRSRTLSFVFVS